MMDIGKTDAGRSSFIEVIEDYEEPGANRRHDPPPPRE